MSPYLYGLVTGALVVVFVYAVIDGVSLLRAYLAERGER